MFWIYKKEWLFFNIPFSTKNSLWFKYVRSPEVEEKDLYIVAVQRKKFPFIFVWNKDKEVEVRKIEAQIRMCEYQIRINEEQTKLFKEGFNDFIIYLKEREYLDLRKIEKYNNWWIEDKFNSETASTWGIPMSLLMEDDETFMAPFTSSSPSSSPINSFSWKIASKIAWEEEEIQRKNKFDAIKKKIKENEKERLILKYSNNDTFGVFEPLEPILVKLGGKYFMPPETFYPKFFWRSRNGDYSLSPVYNINISEIEGENELDLSFASFREKYSYYESLKKSDYKFDYAPFFEKWEKERDLRDKKDQERKDLEAKNAQEKKDLEAKYKKAQQQWQGLIEHRLYLDQLDPKVEWTNILKWRYDTYKLQLFYLEREKIVINKILFALESNLVSIEENSLIDLWPIILMFCFFFITITKFIKFVVQTVNKHLKARQNSEKDVTSTTDIDNYYLKDPKTNLRRLILYYCIFFVITLLSLFNICIQEISSFYVSNEYWIWIFSSFYWSIKKYWGDIIKNLLVRYWK